MEIGDVVYLKSGSPPLTIRGFNGETTEYPQVHVVWMLNGKAEYSTFLLAVLTETNPQESSQ